MGLRRAGGAVAVAILLCALAARSSEGRRRTEEGFFGDGGGSESPDIDKDMVEQWWSHCRKELMDKKVVLKNFDLHSLPDGANDLKLTLLRRRNIYKVIRFLPPQMKQQLLDCLRKKNLRFHVSGQDSFKSWFIKCVELHFGGHNAAGRGLVSNPGSSAVGSPNYDSEPSDLASDSSRSPNPRSLVEAPEEPRILSDILDSPPPPSAHKPSSHVGPPEKSDDSLMRTIIVVTATAAGAVIIVALILLYCLTSRDDKIDLKDGQKDDRPLLTLSLSDFSADSSQKSASFGKSGKKEFCTNNEKNPVFHCNLPVEFDNHDTSFDKAPSSEGTLPFPPLKPPPGRSPPPPPRPPPPPPPSRRPPPPPPKSARPPPRPPKSGLGAPPPPLGPHSRGPSVSSVGNDGESEGPKTKLKPFFWDKVLANPDQSMVWHEIKAGSFQFNEEMIESLFGYNNAKNNNNRKKESSDPSSPYIQIIDTKKAQNLSILLRALNVTTEEVCDAVREGNELPAELVHTLLKMAPTTQEELKLRLFTGDVSQLGPAERFLKVLVEIPFAFKRLESLMFMCSFQEEVSGIKESFATLEVACNKLRNSRLFLKLLEAVLKTGNRMNDGTYRGGAEAFKLDTLLKLADVKGIDGKTTLLHFVVQEIIRSEGIRAVRSERASRSVSSVKTDDFVEDNNQEAADHYRKLGLLVVSGLSTELEDVKKAAIIDADGLSASVSKLGHSLTKAKDFLNDEMSNLDEESDFHLTLASFVDGAEADISWLLEEEKRIMAKVKSTADYFHGHAGKDEGLRLFAIVRDFLIMLDKTCKEVREATAKKIKFSKKENPSASPSSENRQTHSETPSASPSSENHQPLTDIRQRLFPAIVDRRMDSSSSDDESPCA